MGDQRRVIWALGGWFVVICILGLLGLVFAPSSLPPISGEESPVFRPGQELELRLDETRAVTGEVRVVEEHPEEQAFRLEILIPVAMEKGPASSEEMKPFFSGALFLGMLILTWFFSRMVVPAVDD